MNGTDPAPAGGGGVQPALPSAPVVLLATDGPSTRAVYHALSGDHPELRAVLEAPISPATLLRRRLKRLGPWRVAGQVLFLAGVVPILRRGAAGRIAEIRAEHGLDESSIPERRVHRVSSVNAPETRGLLRRLAPRVVVVNGTRIIGRETLAAVEAAFLNMHAGITPLYRGVHGGYWALRDGRPELVGTTVHLVDEGIDTGGVVEQVCFRPAPADSFATYPYLHTAAGLPALRRAVSAALQGTLRPRPAPAGLESRLRHHPTAAEYLLCRLTHGVR